MKSKKITITLSWDRNNACCVFRRGRDVEDWQNMTRDEQQMTVVTMKSMADMFGRFVKKEGDVNND